MSQSFRIVNLDRNEWLNPASLGSDDSWGGQFIQEPGVSVALALLLSIGIGTGPRAQGAMPWEGNPDMEHIPVIYQRFIGRWWNCRLVVISEENHPLLDEVTNGQSLWYLCTNPTIIQRDFATLDEFIKHLRREVGWEVMPHDLYYDVSDALLPLVEFVTGKRLGLETNAFGMPTGKVKLFPDETRSLDGSQFAWPNLPAWLEKYSER